MTHPKALGDKHVQVLEIERLKDANKLNLAAGHNLRADGRDPAHIDATKSHLNKILRGADTVAGIVQKSKELMAGLSKKPRKDFVRWLEVVISLPSGTGIDEHAFFSESVTWAEGFFEMPILSAIVHNDEKKPHIHILMLPLFQGRMIGSSQCKPTKYWERHKDFNAKVGRRFGLKMPEPKIYHSAEARAAAAENVIETMKKSFKNLEPAFWDAMRATLKITPEPFMEYYGTEYPAKPKKKPKTFAEIISKPCKLEKTKAFHVDQSEFAKIDKTKALHIPVAQETKEALPVYGFPSPSISVVPDDASLPVEYHRENENEQSPKYWDGERGEFIRPPANAKRMGAGRR